VRVRIRTAHHCTTILKYLETENHV